MSAELTPTVIDLLAERDRALAVHRRLTLARGASFFTSPEYLGVWIDAVAARVRPLYCLIGPEDDPRAGFVFVRRERRKAGLLPWTTLHLGETGDPELDAIYIEYNGFAGDVDLDGEGLVALLRRLPFHWDEFRLSGLSPEFYPGRIATVGGAYWRVERESLCASRRLDSIGEGREGLLAAFEKSRRTRLKQAYAFYKRLGEPRTETPDGPDEAHAWLDALHALHTARFAAEGKTSAFGPWLLGFLHGLIDALFASGGVRLFRVSAGEATIGYTLNFYFAGRVYFYQSGYVYLADNKARPGVVSVLEAMRRSRDLGATVFDLMAGAESQPYKRMLADRFEPLFWARLFNPSIKTRFYLAALGLRDRLRAWLKRSSS